MSFTKSFGRRALGAFRGLVTSTKAVLKSKQTGKEPRASISYSVSEHLQQVLSSSDGKPSQSVKPRFVVLVFIQYTGWYCGTPERPQSMQLNSVGNDFVEVLNYLGYRHDDEKTMWRLLTDLDLDYTDGAGNTQRLPRIHPTREAILKALTEAGETGGSGLAYFGAHGGYGLPGTSVLKANSEGTHYSIVNTQEQAKSPSSYLIAIDGGRIYGEEIFDRLPEDVPAKCVHTVAFDTCHAEGVASAATNVHYAYNGETPSGSAASLEVSAEIASAEQRTSKQLVIISAAREGELARTVRPGETMGEYGKLTWYMIHWLKKWPKARARNLAERLRYTGVKLAKPGEEQNPKILARYPLTNSFELLPGLLRRSVDESRAVGSPTPPPITIRWSRLASGRMR